MTTQEKATEETKPKRDYVVSDAQALYDVYPQFFKLVPDYAKIKQAIKLGLPMPGVELLPSHPGYAANAVHHAPSTAHDDGSDEEEFSSTSIGSA